ncbi:MAG: hypothetical protein AB7E60_06635 [Sphingobium sp.]
MTDDPKHRPLCHGPKGHEPPVRPEQHHAVATAGLATAFDLPTPGGKHRLSAMLSQWSAQM